MFITTQRARRRLAVLTVTPLLAIAACSSDSDGERADLQTLGSEEVTAGDTTSDDTATDATDPDSTSTAHPAEDSQPGETVAAMTTAVSEDIDQGRPTEPIVTRRGTAPFKELQIDDFRRDGKTVTLEFTIIVLEGESDSVAVADIFAAPQDRYVSEGGKADVSAPSRQYMSGVTLVDQANRKRHLVLRDTTGACVCTSWRDAFADAGPHRFSVQFPSPPADVSEMSIDVPNFPVIDGVPLREVGN